MKVETTVELRGNRLLINLGDKDIKVALTEKGYEDNVSEVNLYPTMKEFVPKLHDTTGYVNIVEHVTPMVPDELSNYNEFLELVERLVKTGGVV